MAKSQEGARTSVNRRSLIARAFCVQLDGSMNTNQGYNPLFRQYSTTINNGSHGVVVGLLQYWKVGVLCRKSVFLSLNHRSSVGSSPPMLIYSMLECSPRRTMWAPQLARLLSQKAGLIRLSHREYCGKWLIYFQGMTPSGTFSPQEPWAPTAMERG